MFRLKGWKYNPASSRRPRLMANITVDLVFDRIGPGLTKDLKQREIAEETGKTGRLHQVLTTDVGPSGASAPSFWSDLCGKGFDDGDWEAFYRFMDRTAPRYNRTLPLPFDEPVAEVKA
jgi:hypothetical protein